MIAYDVRHYDSVDSTNDEALRLARVGTAHGTVVCARQQTAGRGRLARHWHSPVGNLYASILLRAHLTPGDVAELSFVAALAVADTVDRLLPRSVRAELKWPNDVLVHGAKIAGILLECADPVVVVGIGLNVLWAPSDVPYPVTSLAACGAVAPDTDGMLRILLESFADRFATWQTQGFPQVRSEWLTRAHPSGSPMRVSVGDRLIVGQFIDLADDGAMIVEAADGTVRIVAGDVTISAK